jgi:hypothetical protein
MNERLLELARQAGLKKDHGSDREYLGNFDWREFAELIVQECAEVAAKVVVEHEGVDFGLVEACYEHFGVES